MENLTRIQANNADLQECIDKANALPDVAGGGSIDTSGVTATADEVLAGEKFIGADGKLTEGTMPNVGNLGISLTPSNNRYTIPKGYHNGSGSVSVDVEQILVTPTKSQQTIGDANGSFIGNVIVEPIPDEYVIPSGTLKIEDNGTHDVSKYASVNVDVPPPDGYVDVSGTLDITTNGIHVVDTYQFVDVDVPIPDEYVIPSGTKKIEDNGTHNVSGFASVDVDVPPPDGYVEVSGTRDITENGIYVVDTYQFVNVNVPSSGDSSIDGLLSNTLTDLNSNATSVRAHMFRGSNKLVSVNLPEVKSLGDYAFYSASGLETVNMPKLETAGSQIFYTCNKLKSIVFPSLVTSGSYLFRDCTYLEFIDLPKLTEIEASMFNGCRSLTALILRSTTLVPLANTNAFTNCYRILGTKNSGVNPNGEKCGFIYVPRALLEDYKLATNWVSDTLVTQLRAIEDYPEITGG